MLVKTIAERKSGCELAWVGVSPIRVGDQRGLLVGAHCDLQFLLTVAGGADGARSGSPVEGSESHEPLGGDKS